MEPDQDEKRPIGSWADRVARAVALPAPSVKEVEEPQPRESTCRPSPVSVPVLSPSVTPRSDRPVIVVDAGALLRVEALDRYRTRCAFVTTPAAAQEVRDAVSRQRISQRFLDIETLDPTDVDLAWARKFAGMTGDLGFLSETDLGLIALTYMLQRSTGQTGNLKMKPAAFEAISEAEMARDLEEGSDVKILWSLQPPKSSNSTTDEGNAKQKAESSNSEDESDDKAEDACEDDSSDDDGWVTEELLQKHLGLLREPQTNSESSQLDLEALVSCMTTDFSMQNVLLQMGLDVVSPDGRKIKTVKIWALLCRACQKVERDSRLLFCSKCGHNTLDRVPLYFDQKSCKTYIFDGRKFIKRRGQIYTIPKNQGGKKSRPIILAADQLLMGGLDREIRRKEKLWRKDVASRNPFSGEYCLEAQSWHARAFTASGRAAAAEPPKIVVGLGKGNPNSNRWMKYHSRQRK